MKRTILIVENNDSRRDMFTNLLTLRGYEVVEAVNGTDGLILAASHEIDAAISKLNLAGMNGITFCRALRKQNAAVGRKLPVWIMASSQRAEMVKRALAAGAQGVLRTPRDVVALSKRFERAFQLHTTNPSRGRAIKGEGKKER